MTRTLAALSLLLLLCAAARAQGDSARPSPTPVDVVEDEIYETTWLAILDNFAVELQSRPGARAYLVAYGVPNRMPGWPLRRANWARGYLTSGRGIDPSRVEVVFGGYRDKVKYEHWVLDAGERPPVEPFDFAAALAREKSAYKLDQFWLYDPHFNFWYDGSYSEYLDDRGRYEALALALRNDPAARGLIIAYPGKKDRANIGRRLAEIQKKAVLTTHAVAPDRVVAAGGGRRKQRYAEVWIVPPGAELPKPTPPARADTRRKSKRR